MKKALIVIAALLLPVNALGQLLELELPGAPTIRDHCDDDTLLNIVTTLAQQLSIGVLELNKESVKTISREQKAITCQASAKEIIRPVNAPATIQYDRTISYVVQLQTGHLSIDWTLSLATNARNE